MNVEGGSAIPIHITTNAPVGAPALPVYLYTQVTLGDRQIESGITSVYSVSDAELANGTFKLAGNITAIPVIDYTSLDTAIPDVHPIPVYILNPPIPTPPVVIPWYLAGGVNLIDCVAAYQSISSVDYSVSKINLANSGTHNLTDSLTVPWDSTNGWKFQDPGTSLKYLMTDFSFTDIDNGNGTVIISFNNWSQSLDRSIFGADYFDDDSYLTESIIGLKRTGHPISTNLPENSYRQFCYNKSVKRISTTLPSSGIVASCNNGDLYLNGTLVSETEISVNFTNAVSTGEPTFYIGSSHYKDNWADGQDILPNLLIINITAVAFYKTLLTAGQIAAITSAIQIL